MKETYFRHYGSALQEQSKDLRKNMTEPERKLWFCFLKEQKPKFSCQKIIGPYIVDFYCPELQLVIELDGESHTETVSHDLEREAYLRKQGIKIVHFTNEDIRYQFSGVCEEIRLNLVPPLQGAVGEANVSARRRHAGAQPGVARLLARRRGCNGFNGSDVDETTPRLAPQVTPLNRGDEPVRVIPLKGGTRKGILHMKTVTIYTDGACSGNPGPGGWGAILRYNGTEKELSGGEAQTTNNRMELTAVITALAALKEPCIVELYSDSKYVIDALEKGWVYGWKKKGWIKSDKKPALNVDLWEQLLPLVARHEVHYHWVKGHAENEKNNRCDQMAVAESKKFQS